MKRSLRYLFCFCLVYWSIEILVRRWLWHQIPTQVFSVMVYGFLIFNVLVVVKVLSVSKSS